MFAVLAVNLPQRSPASAPAAVFAARHSRQLHREHLSVRATLQKLLQPSTMALPPSCPPGGVRRSYQDTLSAEPSTASIKASPGAPDGRQAQCQGNPPKLAAGYFAETDTETDVASRQQPSNFRKKRSPAMTEL